MHYAEDHARTTDEFARRAARTVADMWLAECGRALTESEVAILAVTVQGVLTNGSRRARRAQIAEVTWVAS